MAKRKATQVEKEKTILIKPREVFRNELLERISIGESYYNKDITFEQLNGLYKEVASWCSR